MPKIKYRSLKVLLYWWLHSDISSTNITIIGFYVNKLSCSLSRTQVMAPDKITNYICKKPNYAPIKSQYYKYTQK